MLGIQESENSIISDWATIARQMDDLDGIKREKAREKYNHHVAILADYLFERMRTGSFPSYSPIHSFIFSIDPSIHLEKHVKKAFELMLIAGHHTTGYAIGNLLARLSEQKSIQKKVAENRELVPICIEESLRLDSPVIEMRRRTFCTSTVSSEVIDEGQEVALCWGQANRDPAYFEAPNSFHLHRRETKHLAFGTGLHKCVGSALARMEMAIALNRLLEVHKSWELSSACLRLEEGNIGVLSIPVTFGVN
jgi:cytochrome P450